MTDILGALLQQGLLELDFVAQMGLASGPVPLLLLSEAKQPCNSVSNKRRCMSKRLWQRQYDPEATNAEKTARLAAAHDYQQRVQRAIEGCPRAQSQ